MKFGIFDLIQPPFGLGLVVDTLPSTGFTSLPSNISTPILGSPIFSAFPAAVRDLLAALSIEELHMAYDDEAIVYYGDVQVLGDGLNKSTAAFHAPSGHFIELGDLGFQFRITFPRSGSQTLSNSIDSFAGNSALSTQQKTDFNDLKDLLAILGKTDGSVPSDYPTKRFRMELLFNSIVLHLPNDRFKPARLAADGWLERDPNFDEVTISLGKIAMTITNNSDNYSGIDVDFDGWGVNSLDEPTDVKAGEAIEMRPSLCLNASNTFGFGIDKVVMDFSADFTPPEIIEKNFGVGDDFKGLWIPKARIFVAMHGLKGMAFDTWGENLLFDFKQGFSGEIGMELVNNVNRAPLEVDIIFFAAGVAESSREASKSIDANNNVTKTSFHIFDIHNTIQIRVKGGTPPYKFTVKKNGVEVTAQAVDGDTTKLNYIIDGNEDDDIELLVRVEDSLKPQARFYQDTTSGICTDVAQNLGKRDPKIQDPQLEQLTGSDQYKIKLAPLPQNNDDAVQIQTVPDNAEVTVGGNIIQRLNNGNYVIPVKRDGVKVDVTASFAVAADPNLTFTPFHENDPTQNNTGENVFILQFTYDHPKTTSERDDMLAAFSGDPNIRDRLKAFLNRQGNRHLVLHGYASFEGESSNASYNKALTDRRLFIIQELIKQASGSSNLPAGTTSNSTGFDEAKQNGTTNNSGYRVAIAFFNAAMEPAIPDTATARVWRDQDIITPVVFVPPPAPIPPKHPSAFRRIAAKVKWLRNDPVFAEVFLEVDVVDETKRNAGLIQSRNSDLGSEISDVKQAVKTSPGATSNQDPENQGILDVRISALYDVATGILTQTLTLGFDKNNVRDGFVTIDPFNPKPLSNTLASLLLFLPLLQQGAEAIQSSESDADRTKAIKMEVAEIAIAATLGIFAIEMVKITLFGAELTISETSPDVSLWNPQQVTSLGILLDYAVDFKINFDLFGILTIKTKDEDPNTPNKKLLPPRARYKAIGFNMQVDPATREKIFQPIFDTSKGYELSLGDPGALEVTAFGTSLNKLLRILSARVGKENPTVFEVDLAMNVNLGIITVDTVRVRLTIQDDGKKNLEIIPTKVGVNIPGILTGTGYLDFGNNSGSGSVAGTTGGFQGYVDITLVPVKLRIAASVGIQPIHTDGRDATAFFLGMEVDFPAAIPLANTGLGIYGFLGLFAMHYKRAEPISNPGELPPALKWFYNDPIKGNVINIQGWTPNLDNWSFGLGILLGTMEGGFVLNMKGMFILELPGPRILIFVKASLLVTPPKDVKDAGNKQSVGVLAVVDLDFNLHLLTIGVILEYSVESVLSLRVPVVSQFSTNEPKNWFVDLGNNLAPAEALIFGIAKGYAYLMIHGNGIKDWPKLNDPQVLFGFSLAFGIGASLVFGDKDSGLYLEVGGDLAAGIGFSPFHYLGTLVLRGQLHLWIVSVSAHADLKVEGNEKTAFASGDVCGSVDFCFFSIDGCVHVEFGNQLDTPPAPDLVTSLTLVSRSSALMAGQGIDRPIDGALGKAALKGTDPTDDDKLLIVPIDSIPVFNLFATPDVGGCQTFTDPLTQSPTYISPGYVSIGAGNFIQYRLTSLAISKPLLEDDKPKPVNFWKKPTDNPGDDESSVDMAILSWSPDPTPRAVQRSKELDKTVTDRWEIVCKQIAPATTVFYCFNKKPLGYSVKGWHLDGIAWPDEPGTIRSTPPDTSLFVYENVFPDSIPATRDAWLAVRHSIVDQAKVIGGSAVSTDTVVATVIRLGRVLQFPFEAAADPVQQVSNPSPGTIEAIKSFEPENIFIDTGELQGAEILLALSADILAPKEIIVRTLDANFKVLQEARAPDVGFKAINTFTDLPDHWKDVAGPWNQDIKLVFAFLDQLAKEKKQSRILLHYKGIKGMRYIEIVTKRAKLTADGPSLLLCAMEMFTAAEFRREENDTSTQQTDNDTLTDALEGEPLRALLQPGSRYELTINYEFKRKVNGVEEDHFAAAAPKTFVFKTDAKAPLRLDPWILTSTPQNDMRYHFIDDPVQVYLNDESVIQLFKAYNVTLLAKVKKANGIHPPVNDPSKMKLDMLNLSQVKKVKAAIKTPYQHTLENVVKDKLPCINDTGKREEHVVFTIDSEYLLNTEYTVEIIKEGEIVTPGANTYKTPLYKFAFRTSRYNSASAFAGALNAANIKTMMLSSRPVAPINVECTDSELQDVLFNAGLTSLKIPSDPSIAILWSLTVSGGIASSKLEAILVDIPEPLWRKRPYPDEETVQSESGDMTHWVMVDKPEMELVEAADTQVVSKIVRTKGGTRTIIFLNNDAAGKQLHLQLKKHQFTHVKEDYGTPATFELFDVMNIALPSLAPWDQEE